jgi:hypothetical protein
VRPIVTIHRILTMPTSRVAPSIDLFEYSTRQ